MIYVGIDDTDTLDTRGTNQLARLLAQHVLGRAACRMIVRHQLLEDWRVPCTSKNGSASLVFDCDESLDPDAFARELRGVMESDFVPGSDPGLCVATHVPPEIVDYGRRCKTSWIEQDEPRGLARKHGFYLEGLGGTEGGVIGALAAIGLVATGDDGRIVQFGPWPDDLTGLCDAESIRSRQVDIRDLETLAPIETGTINVGKRLRPNLRHGRPVLFVSRNGDHTWEAIRLK